MPLLARRAALLLVAPAFTACADSNSCTDEILVAVSIMIDAPDGVTVDKVTIEQTHEETCDTVRIPSGGKVYQCFEQHGGGTYLVRVYSGGKIWTATEQLESQGCHIKTRVDEYFDLSVDP